MQISDWWIVVAEAVVCTTLNTFQRFTATEEALKSTTEEYLQSAKNPLDSYRVPNDFMWSTARHRNFFLPTYWRNSFIWQDSTSTDTNIFQNYFTYVNMLTWKHREIYRCVSIYRNTNWRKRACFLSACWKTEPDWKQIYF